jgi:hypothetical protein
MMPFLRQSCPISLDDTPERDRTLLPATLPRVPAFVLMELARAAFPLVASQNMLRQNVHKQNRCLFRCY